MTYYIYKGHIYEICGAARMKDSIKGWIDAVQYRRADNPGAKDKQQNFVREKSDFDEKFIKIQIENSYLQKITPTENIPPKSQECITLYKSGMPPKEIIKELRWKKTSTVYTTLKRYHIPYNK